jgi:hypothetical protein
VSCSHYDVCLVRSKLAFLYPAAPPILYITLRNTLSDYTGPYNGLTVDTTLTLTRWGVDISPDLKGTSP